ncbi:MAG: metallophosphoesterase [Planctomycetia bacterium]|nr:metallophosphoesterase [Planctomycetia bacterium]
MFVPRRQFLTAGAALGLGTLLCPKESLASDSGQVKFSVFSDIHHFPGVFMPGMPAYLTQIQERAMREKCDFIIHCGDFTHNPPSVPDFVTQYNAFSIPSYHTLGNHDHDGCTVEETLAAYGLERGYYFFDRGGFRFIVTDPNYFEREGVYTHYSKGNYYQYRGASLSVVPPEQLAWLRDTIFDSPNPCVLFSHQSFEREVGGVRNASEVRALFDEANRRCPGRVRLVINGHHHRDNLRLWNGIVYFDLNSTSYDWVEKSHTRYPRELVEKNRLMNHILAYTDPIHAVITLGCDGTMRIEGMESTMYLGVTRSDIGASLTDAVGRPVYPRVQCVKMKLDYEA